MDAPLVSVVTPTWQRCRLLLERCVPSVQQQTYVSLEHIIVSDGPDPDLAAAICETEQRRPIRFSELPVHEPSHYGHKARMAGIEAAGGDFIAYLDDDDSYRPDHLAIMMRALLEAEAPWGYPSCLVHLDRGEVRIGDGRLARGRVGTSMIIHRREILRTQTWLDEPGPPDWNLIYRWTKAGLLPVSVDEVTVDYYPGTSFNQEMIPCSSRPLGSI